MEEIQRYRDTEIQRYRYTDIEPVSWSRELYVQLGTGDTGSGGQLEEIQRYRFRETDIDPVPWSRGLAVH